MSYDPVRDNGHCERMARKHDRILGLEALLKTHEDKEWPDVDYIRELKKKIDRVRTQLKNMRP